MNAARDDFPLDLGRLMDEVVTPGLNVPRIYRRCQSIRWTFSPAWSPCGTSSSDSIHWIILSAVVIRPFGNVWKHNPTYVKSAQLDFSSAGAHRNRAVKKRAVLTR